MFKKIISLFLVSFLLSGVVAQAKTFFYFQELESLVDAPDSYPFDGSAAIGINPEDVTVSIVVSNSLLISGVGTSETLDFSIAVDGADFDDVTIGYTLPVNTVIESMNISDNSGESRQASLIKTETDTPGSVDVELTASISGTTIATKTVSIMVSGNCPAAISIDTADANDASGTGRIIYCDADDKYLISTSDDLKHISINQNVATIGARILAGDFLLTDNITLSSSDNFTPIGISSKPFAGNFDGDGYSISNLYINLGTNRVGMFGYVNPGSVIENVGLKSVNVTGASETGALVGYNRGIISNSYSAGSVTGYDNTGGLVGYNYNGSSISYSYSTAAVSGHYYIGGLIGRTYFSTITDSYAAFSTAPSGPNYVNGLIGYVQSTSVNNFNGICEYVTSNNKTSCTERDVLMLQASWDPAKWAFSETSKLALINEVSGSETDITCNITDPLDGWDIAGDGYYLIGGGSGKSVLAKQQLRCLSYVQNRPGNSVLLSSNYRLTTNVDLGDSVVWKQIGITPAPFAGNFDGDGYSISNMHLDTGSINGGMFGYVNAGSVIENVGLKSADITGGSDTGGLIGYNKGAVRNSYTTGSVTGYDNIGGIVGYTHNGSSVSYSYSTAAVSGHYYIGGVVGRTYYATITDSYAAFSTAPVGPNYVNGLIGYVQSSSVNNFNGICEYVTSNNKTSCAERDVLMLQASWDPAKWAFAETSKLALINEVSGSETDITCNISDPLDGWNTAGDGYYLIGGNSGDSTLAKQQLRCLSYVQNRPGNSAILSSNYRLTTNVDLGGSIVWKQIGIAPAPFTGNFDGDGYAISNMHLDTGSLNGGMFGYVNAGSVIENVGLKSADITGYSETGALVGYNKGIVRNSYTTGSVTGYDMTGGIVGYNYNGSSVSYSYSTAAVSGHYYVGGLVGRANYSTITDSYAAFSTAPSGPNYVNGLVGYTQGATINNLSGICEYLSSNNKTSCSEGNAISLQNNSWPDSIWKTLGSVKTPLLENE